MERTRPRCAEGRASQCYRGRIGYTVKLADVYRDVCVPLERALHHPVVIAGGAPRDHLLGRRPRDYDVFILAGKLGPPMVNKVCKDARAVCTLIAHADGELVTASSGKYDGPKVSPIAQWDWRGTHIQVMYTPHKDVTSLLASFDWNICCAAYADGVYTKLPVWNTKVLTLVSTPQYPLVTLRRGYEFSNRYSMKLEDHTARTLCKQVATEKIDAIFDFLGSVSGYVQ